MRIAVLSLGILILFSVVGCSGENTASPSDSEDVVQELDIQQPDD